MKQIEFMFYKVNVLLLIFFQCLTNVSIGQNCVVSIPDEISVCGSDTIKVEALGNNYKIQWFDSEKTKIDTGAILNKFVNSNQKFYLINRLDLGPELIKNGDFEFGNSDFETDYFESCNNPSMPQGSYCITNTTNQFHPAWSSCGDHTSGSGKMYVSDGAAVPNQKLWCQTVAVEQNKTYAFSAWLTSLIAINPPIMQFSINDELLGSPFQADINPCEWNEFFQTWESGLNTSAEICILNQNTAGNGNDFGVDDISFRSSCIYEDSIDVLVIDEVKVDLGEDQTICEGEDVKLFNKTSNTVNVNYEWTTQENQQEITVNSIGTYGLTLTTAQGCSGYDEIELIDIGFPESELGQDTVVCFNAIGKLDLYPGEAKLVVWRIPGRGVDTTVNLLIRTSGSYVVDLINGENCITTDEIVVDSLCANVMFFPSAFTPNGDGLNDVFYAYATENYGFNMQIFNKWGALIYESGDMFEGWDGTVKGGRDAAQGIYVYRCSYSIIDNNTNLLSDNIKTGIVTLIR